jgi:hypothetical protein
MPIPVMTTRRLLKKESVGKSRDSRWLGKMGAAMDAAPR